MVQSDLVDEYEEIEQLEADPNKDINKLKERLAFEVTKLVHGEEEALKCVDTARALFSDNQIPEDMPSTVLEDNLFVDGSIGLLDMLVAAGLCPSKGEGRRLVQQGGIVVNENKISDPSVRFQVVDFHDGYVIIKKGKKIYHKALLNQ
jgi:tyrosyl-tRNA synthetase